MDINRVVPNITSDRVNESKAFYTELFGFQVAMDLGWIITLVSPSNPTAQISIVLGEPSVELHNDVTISIEVADVDAVHETASSKGHEIVYELTDESWGVRRFHIRDPNGVLLNVMTHVK